MKKVIAVALLALVVFGCCMSSSRVCVYAQTSVGGLITSDTTWSPAGNPYVFTGAVGVETGVTLTIESGTTVNLEGYFMEVNGTLSAQGTSSSNIVFCAPNNYNSGSNMSQSIDFMPSSSGSIIENALFNSTGVFIQGCSPTISDSTFDSPETAAINIAGGSPQITRDVINYPGLGEGIIANSGVITNNEINIDSWIDGVTLSGDVTFTDNAIVGDSWISVQISDGVIFEGNTVAGSIHNGISSDASCTIQQNYIANNKVGISGGGTIEENTIIDNSIGVQPQNSGSTTVHDNNIYDNTQSIVLSGSSNVDASNNWWGTTDTSSIASSIYDSTEDFTLGTVTYNPILTSPDSNAPSDPLVPIASSTPEPTQQASNSNTQPTAVPRPTATPSTQWQSSIGSGSSSPENSWESAILQWAKIAIVGVAVAWVVVALVFVGRRIRKK